MGDGAWPAGGRALRQDPPEPGAMISVVIPTLGEAQNLERLLPELHALSPGIEVIVADAGSQDGTEAVVARYPWVRLVSSPLGRARQMNAGARVATRPVLLFLHADTRLPPGFDAAIARALEDPAVGGGRFDVRLDSRRLAFRVIEAFMNLRSRLSGIATGDQAIFLRRTVFEALGGYADIPLMEDVELTRRLKRHGRLACLRLRVTTSARKWEREGILRTVALMWVLRGLYFCGVSAERLHRWYYRTLAAALVGVVALVALAASASGEGSLEIGRFTPPAAIGGLPEGWEALTFKKVPRHTRYSVVRDGEGWVLRAESQAAASGLYRPLDLDPRAYPILSWRWKVDTVLRRADARRKEGDDYAARVYVAFRYDPATASLWEKTTYGAYRTLYGRYPPKGALSYVWDNRLAPGTTLDNAYTSRTKMIVLRSGSAQMGQWVSERRDLAEDYRRLFGADPPRIAGVAVMTDTDDTGESAVAYYDAITLGPAD